MCVCVCVCTCWSEVSGIWCLLCTFDVEQKLKVTAAIDTYLSMEQLHIVRRRHSEVRKGAGAKSQTASQMKASPDGHTHTHTHTHRRAWTDIQTHTHTDTHTHTQSLSILQPLPPCEHKLTMTSAKWFASMARGQPRTSIVSGCSLFILMDRNCTVAFVR